MVTIPKEILDYLKDKYVHDMDLRYYLSRLTSIEQYIVIRRTLEGAQFNHIHRDIMKITSKHSYADGVFKFAIFNNNFRTHDI